MLPRVKRALRDLVRRVLDVELLQVQARIELEQRIAQEREELVAIAALLAAEAAGGNPAGAEAVAALAGRRIEDFRAFFKVLHEIAAASAARAATATPPAPTDADWLEPAAHALGIRSSTLAAVSLARTARA